MFGFTNSVLPQIPLLLHVPTSTVPFDKLFLSPFTSPDLLLGAEKTKFSSVILPFTILEEQQSPGEKENQEKEHQKRGEPIASSPALTLRQEGNTIYSCFPIVLSGPRPDDSPEELDDTDDVENKQPTNPRRADDEGEDDEEAKAGAEEDIPFILVDGNGKVIAYHSEAYEETNEVNDDDLVVAADVVPESLASVDSIGVDSPGWESAVVESTSSDSAAMLVVAGGGLIIEVAESQPLKETKTKTLSFIEAGILGSRTTAVARVFGRKEHGVVDIAEQTEVAKREVMELKAEVKEKVEKRRETLFEWLQKKSVVAGANRGGHSGGNSASFEKVQVMERCMLGLIVIVLGAFSFGM